MTHLFITIALLLTIASTANADIYKYRDASGRLRFTDDWFSIPKDQRPPYRPPSANRPSAPTFNPQVTAPPQTAPTEPRHSVSAPITPKTRTPPRRPQSRPVDTHSLNLIRIGMSMSEVHRRLGPPAEILDLGEKQLFTYSPRTHTGQSTTVPRVKWVYPGNPTYPPAHIIFEASRVTYRGRE